MAKASSPNWRLTGQDDMFNAASSLVELGMKEVWAVYQRLADKERALLNGNAGRQESAPKALWLANGRLYKMTAMAPTSIKI